jgi:hypothetical protein
MPEAPLRLGELRDRLDGVRSSVESCARRCGRDPREITLVGVSKTHPASLVAEARDAGLADFGENRVQEAEGKIAELSGLEGPPPRWHLIGHLQANKARRAVKLFDVIHTVDSAALVARLERLCAEEGRDELHALVQLSLAGEETKAGAGIEELDEIVAAFKVCERVRLAGLMTVPPFFEDAEAVRPFFRRLRELRDSLRERGAFDGAGGDGATGHLSMGMSHDFEAAVEEGATMVRVGTAIFGERAGV